MVNTFQFYLNLMMFIPTLFDHSDTFIYPDENNLINNDARNSKY